MKKLTAIAIFLLGGILSMNAQRAPVASDFKTFTDSLFLRLERRTTVQNIDEIRVSRALRRGNTLDIYFNSNLGDYPWHQADYEWLLKELSAEVKRINKSYSLGKVFVGSIDFHDLVTPVRTSDGRPNDYVHKVADPGRGNAVVKRVGARKYPRGLDGRNIALWQSHGMYYNETQDRWMWQRARVHRTSEDFFTQSFVLPFLIPMLENAGAYVMTPRERDTHVLEYIIDNDRSFSTRREGALRRSGKYSEKGSWSTAGEGFADFKESYSRSDNPFTAGTARGAACTSGSDLSTVRWTPDIEQRGQYAVYVSYRSEEGSCTAARYTVHHMGGDTVLEVDQTRGGGTWIYIGTFEFDRGEKGWVSLDNKGAKGQTVTADAVKIGGGMGKLARGNAGARPRVSGVPSYLEGASYWLQWAGIDSTIVHERETDYINDYTSRADWVEELRKERNVPFDLSLAFHSDAGVTPGDSTVGTLAIYTLMSEGSRKYANGAPRDVSRLYAEYVQDQVVSDIRAGFDSQWSRRMIWNRSYYEARATEAPAMILETMSHQNLADMRYGTDPSFKFALSRAVYKGMLKFLGDLYGIPYTVQPLPVSDLALRFVSEKKASLSWTPREDPLEPTATPKGYAIWRRIDDGAFVFVKDVKESSAEVDIEPGHIYSFKVIAWNDGGESFPSEVLSIGRPGSPAAEAVLVVNNFTRVSSPAWFDAGTYAGFDARTDSGVPYISDLSYIGENYEFRRSKEWITDDNSGWGASYDDGIGLVVKGNTFDNIYPHGKLLMELGYPFYSLSSSAFQRDQDKAWAMDLICGKQVTTDSGRDAGDRFSVFPQAMQDALTAFTQEGGSILVTGANIATDVWSDIQPTRTDSSFRAQSINFVRSVLGYSFTTDHGTHRGALGAGAGLLGHEAEFYSNIGEEGYCVENPDAIEPVDSRGSVVLRYSGTGLSAAVNFNAGSYRVTAIGLPLESLKSESDRLEILRKTMEWLRAL